MIRFLSSILILLSLTQLFGGLFLYLSALVLYCTGQYVGFTIWIVLSTIVLLNFIDDAGQIPNYFYQIVHNQYKHEDYDDVPLMIAKEKE